MHMGQDAEKYVYSKVWPEAEQKRDISWLPREQAMTMHKSSEETEAELHKVHSCQVRMCLLTRAGADKCSASSYTTCITVDYASRRIEVRCFATNAKDG
jgi:hypothetical protein